MNMFSITVLIICSIIYFIDFVYILRFKAYCFKKSKDGSKILAGGFDALFSFAVAITALSRVILNFFIVPEIILTIHFFILLLFFIITIFRQRLKY